MKKLLTLFVALIATVSLMAQVTSSSISGKITDQRKGVLPGATVVATHTPSGAQYYAVADANGNYRLLNIRPGGPYKVEYRMVGFQTVIQEGITATLGETKILNVRMNEESIGLGEVVVAAEAISNGMDSDRAGATTTVSTEQITALPTITRSLNDVMALTPQAAATSNGLAIGGGNYRSSYVTVDGAAFNNAFGIGGNLPAGGSPISLDAIEAMTINITPFDVRHSGFTGGAINAVTKSGTNNWHVSVYDYFTNDGLIGTKFGKKDEFGNFPERLKLSQSLDNTVGFSVGGPIVRDKLFFFVNFEYQSDVDPGQTSFARESEEQEYGGSTQYNRPTVEKMEEIKNYLQTTYGYDPGRYQNYSASTPDIKLLARLDWNAGANDKINVRYSLVKNKYSTAPSSSINPLSSSVYNRNTYGRTSEYALYFESSRYFQEQNFSSVAAEWNHSFLSGRANNMLRATYSHQYEPRSFVGDLFPTVDILEPLEDGTPAVYTSFGPDPFTYGNLRDVQTAVVTDEFTYLAGINNLTFGLQYEFDNTKNGFMQGGAGYYVYNSWNDFVTNANPRAFAITYGNNENHTQVYPSFNYMQGSVYAQDELTFSENFRLTAGLRVEVPWYPSIAGYNTNREFDSLAAVESFYTNANGEAVPSTIYGLSTANMPKARVNFSPRLGFNWDLTGDRKYIIRGGSGLYTGRLPFVWIVSTVGNSNCLQNQYINSNEEEQIKFFTNPNEIIANNADLLLTGDLPAPQSTTIMDQNLRMPQTWKSSLAADIEIPGGIKATVEGIYNKDITSVAVTKLGIVENGTIQLPGEPGERMTWTSEGIMNSLNKAVTPYYITNTDKNGYYYSVTGQLSKRFNFGLDLMAAYTYAEGKNVTDAIGDQVTSAYNTNAFGINGSNVHELGYSSYVSPNRVLVNVGWNWATGQHTNETIGLYYEGFNHCYIGGYSYTRYSYTMTSNVNGDGGSNSLAYIPTEAELETMPFVSAENKADFNDFIKADKYLSTHRGQYAERGGAIAPWRHTFNFKYERTYKFHGGESISFGVDVKNIANLFWRGWGNMQRLSSSDIIKLTGNGTDENPYTYQFTNPIWSEYASTYSTWSAALNLRFNF
ncbi:MAG: TonB-dependent receptor [Bacteroidales bacterium]|nr:TonB-dependent receptor [Bacteroidales bacterium]